ncbi:MAG TPA: hypothetical protein VF593_01040 [Chthoniobacteraceae bacterium]|jgi:hypothetical protein
MIAINVSAFARTLLGTIAAGLLATSANASSPGQPGQWFIAIHPSESGKVQWTTSDPAASGELTTSGTIPFAVTGSDIEFKFAPAAGYQIGAIYTVHYNFTPYLTPPDNFIRFRPEPPDAPVPTLYVVFEKKVPTGVFPFAFPLGKPGVTPIADITGSYQGRTPTLNQRPYDVAVAMDEAGKVMSMGTIEGVTTREGSSQLSALVGSVSTRNGEPIGQGRGRFSGMLDGIEAKGTAKGSGPVEFEALETSAKTSALTDSGGLALAGTGSYSAKVGLMAFKDKNMPVSVPVESTGSTNIKKDWSVEVSLIRKFKPRTNKPYIAASAILTLPNGDSISFREKAARFSERTGYSLSFSRGTNTTAEPDLLDKKSKIKITKMKLVEEETNVWKPVEGTITYNFLGQKGTASLVDFIATAQ